MVIVLIEGGLVCSPEGMLIAELFHQEVRIIKNNIYGYNL